MIFSITSESVAPKKRDRIRKGKGDQYAFKARLWRYKGPNAWTFLTLPKALSLKIREVHLSSEEGWGRLKTTCTVGKTKWETAVWFDTKLGSYLLPIKAEVRKKEHLELGRLVSCCLEFEESRPFWVSV